MDTPPNAFQASSRHQSAAASFVASILANSTLLPNGNGPHIDFFNLSEAMTADDMAGAEEEDEGEGVLSVHDIRPSINAVASDAVSRVISNALSSTSREDRSGVRRQSSIRFSGETPLATPLTTPLPTPQPTPPRGRTPFSVKSNLDNYVDNYMDDENSGRDCEFSARASGKSDTLRTPFASLINKEMLPTSITATNMKKKLSEKDKEIEALRKQLSDMETSKTKLETPARRVVHEWEDELENECPLCMSPLKKKRGSEEAGSEKYTITTHCGHTFHLDCLQSQRSFDIIGCPMCRTDLPKGLTPVRKGSGIPGPARYSGATGGVGTTNAHGNNHRIQQIDEENIAAPRANLFGGDDNAGAGARGGFDARGGGIAEAEEGRGGRGGGSTRSKACVIS
jgi:hypothetical protein